jgi:hypothetical protein
MNMNVWKKWFDKKVSEPSMKKHHRKEKEEREDRDCFSA